VTTAEFFEQLEAPIAPYDMLRHPFYQAWAAGQLTRDDLRCYAQDYYRQVEAAAMCITPTCGASNWKNALPPPPLPPLQLWMPRRMRRACCGKLWTGLMRAGRWQ